MSDALLAERDAHFVRDVDLRSVMHAFGACGNASHHLSQRSGITYHLFAKRNISQSPKDNISLHSASVFSFFLFALTARLLSMIPYPQNSPSVPTKKSLLSIWQKRLFCVMRSLRNVMRTACVMQTSSVMCAFGACVERIASPITAQQHHLSLIRKEVFMQLQYNTNLSRAAAKNPVNRSAFF